MTLTVGGIAGGVASAATSVIADLAKDSNIKADEKAIKDGLAELDLEEKTVCNLFQKIGNNLQRLRDLMKDATVAEMVKSISKNSFSIGYNVVYQGYVVVDSIKAARFAASVAEFIQADFYAMAGIAEGMAAPGIGGTRIFGRALVAAGSTTAKVLSGSLAVLGIGMGIWDIVEGVKDINGSEIAQKYREFVETYRKETKDLKDGIAEMKKMN